MTPPAIEPEAAPTTDEKPLSAAKQRLVAFALVVFLAVLVTGIVVAVGHMLGNPDKTETYRDIVIVFMALEALLLGIALIVLIVQLARLTALLQNEIKPILESTQQTVSTLRGTTTFLSNNMVAPVIRASSSLAALRRALDLFRFGGPRD